ncbi:MAG: hypothetical protein LRY73_19320 [Bacillus sp. (in: Bacteria)]|nr:hypothetical protein [Bacillus sp. (in: firmicutes)]
MVKPAYKKVSSFFLIFVLLLAPFTSPMSGTFAEVDTGQTGDIGESGLGSEESSDETLNDNNQTTEQDQEGIDESTSQVDSKEEVVITVTGPEEDTYLVNESTVSFEGTYENLGQDQV